MQLYLFSFYCGFGPVAAVLLPVRELPPPLHQADGDKRKVCISIAAYEEPEWIDALLDNAHKFTEPTTKIALHLDSKTEYDEGRLRGWNSDKVAVSDDRVSTQAFHGGVLYSHLLNAKVFDKKWPNQCAYFVMGASNMMWVRRGMEAYVREHEMNTMANISCNFNPYICEHPVVLDMTRGDYNMVAWSQPEGLFMPMWIVSEFGQYLDDLVMTKHWNVTEQIVLERGHFEEYWLQTWVRNKHQDIVYSHSRRGDTESPLPLSFRMLGEGVTMEQVRSVMTGGCATPLCSSCKQRHQCDQFAVKRVKRDFKYPTTKYILSLP